MRTRARGAVPTVLVAVLLWLPLLGFELIAPIPVGQLVMSTSALRAAVAAGIVCVGVALVLGTIAAVGARWVAAEPAAGPLAAAGASMLVLAVHPSVHDWAAARRWPPEAGLGALLAVAAGLAVVLCCLPVRLVPRRGRRPVALAAGGLAIMGWLVSVAWRFGVVGREPRLLLLLTSAGAVAVALAGAWTDRRRAGSLAAAALALAASAAIVVGADPGPYGPAGATPVAPAGAPNVVFVLIDTLRADHTTPGGYRHDTTPRLASALGPRTTRFSKAIAAGASTLPSVKSIFTSRLPSANGEKAANLPPPRAAWTLPRAFQEAGYRTVGIAANGLIDAPGFRRGFDEFYLLAGHEFVQDSFLLYTLYAGERFHDAFRRMAQLELHKETGLALAEVADEWLAAHGRVDQPFFLYVHTVDPHWPYYDRGYGLMPAELAGVEAPLSYVDLLLLPKGDPRNALRRRTPAFRELRARYDEEIRFGDEAFGVLLGALGRLGLADDTVVVLVSDHGEEFFEHGGFSHGHDVYEELVHVPLAIRWPAGPRFARFAREVGVPVSLMDLLPTLVDVLGLPAPAAPLAGRSLRPLLEGGETEPHPVVSEAFVPQGWSKAYREGDLKVRFRYSPTVSLADTPHVTVYDLAVDPGERAPLSEQDPRVAPLVARARRHLAALRGDGR